MMKKITALILAAVTLLSTMGMLVGCTEDDISPETTTPDAAEATTVVTADPTLDENGYKKDDIPEDLNYGGEHVFNLLVSDNQYKLSFADENDETLLGASLYERQAEVERRLGLQINLIPKPCNYNTSASFCSDVYTAKNSNSNIYDLIAAYNLTPPVLAHMGLTRELCEEGSYVNFDKPWWGKEAYETIAINGKVFFMTDNSSWNSIKNMLALYINHELAKEYNVNVDEIYDLVAENKWTMKDMFDLCENVYEDSDYSGVKSNGDTFGLVTGTKSWTEGWYYSAGFISTEINDDLTFSFTLGDMETVDFLDWFNSKYHNKNSILSYDSKQYGAFLGERALFYYSACAITLQDLNFAFSAVPSPMYKEDQERYYTHFSNTYDMWCIPTTTADYECSTAVLECLASEAYRIIAPACYDKYLKIRKSMSDRAASMYDVIRDSIIFDFGYVYGLCFSNENTTLNVRRYISGNQTDWISKWRGVEDTYKTEVADLLTKLK